MICFTLLRETKGIQALQITNKWETWEVKPHIKPRFLDNYQIFIPTTIGKSHTVGPGPLTELPVKSQIKEAGVCGC